MKTCSSCKVEKPTSEFGIHRRKADGLRSNCKSCGLKPPRVCHCVRCSAVFNYQARGATPRLCPECEHGFVYCFRCETAKDRGQFYKQTGSRTGKMYICKPCNKSDRDVPSVVRTKKARWIRSRYGISLDEYESHVLAADGVCPCCGKSGRKKMCMDHDHETGAIRGIICSACNSGIGLLGDGIEGLEKALAYLRKVTT